MKLKRSWTARTFSKGLDFLRIVSVLAESEGIVFCFHFVTDLILKGKYNMWPRDVYNAGHHPDLHLVGWNNVTIEIWTHAIGMNYSLESNEFLPLWRERNIAYSVDLWNLPFFDYPSSPRNSYYKKISFSFYFIFCRKCVSWEKHEMKTI